MQIDPLEAVVVWLKNSLVSAGGRVASKHRYEQGWTEAQTGVSVHLDGGAVDLYAELARPRLEVRLYGTPVEVVSLWRELTALCRTQERFEVMTSRGRALVHAVKPETGLSLTWDEVLRKDVGVVFLSGTIAEQAVVS